MSYKIIEQISLGLRMFSYAFVWGKLLGSKILTEETELSEIKKTIDRELTKTELPTLTDEEFSQFAMALKVAQTGVVR